MVGSRGRDGETGHAGHERATGAWWIDCEADAVDQAVPGVLVAALVQVTGDVELLEQAETVRREGSSRTEIDEGLRELARRALGALAESGGPPDSRPELDDDTMCRAMSMCAGEDVPAEYLPLAIEEANFDGADTRRLRWSEGTRPAEADGLRVAVIGGGLAGICLGVRLEQAGIDFTIFDKNRTIGGTWIENDYPDLRVDVPNHFYSYSFEQSPSWSDHYARRAEIAAYVEHCADKYGVARHVVTETEVASARYDEHRRLWSLQMTGPDGVARTREFDVVVSAVGMLNRPSTPDLAGLDDFAGRWFHSSNWDHDLDLTGLRVGVVGTGASAMQFGPSIAPTVAELVVFQRAKHWVLPNPKYHREVPEGEQWLQRHVPNYLGWYRFSMFWENADRIYPAFRVDPEWSDQSLSISEANEKLRRAMTRYLRSELETRPDLVERVLPDYPALGKRMLQDNGWFQMLLNEHVELVNDPIERITEGGVITTDGSLRELDVLVLATGFHANRFLWPIEFVGRGGTVLHDVWGDDPRAHLGITVPSFPNLFCLYGPNTNPVVGSVIFMLECQVNYVCESLRAMIEGGWAAMECRQQVHDDYNERLDAENDKLVWRHPKVRSYYNNASGRVTTNAPWRLIDYWRMTKTPDLDDFHLEEPMTVTTTGGT